MEHDPKTQPGQASPAGLQCAAGETLLRSEIMFWRELLASCDDAQPPEAVDRMRQALALAEFRLLRLYRPEHRARVDGCGR
jgi:hypothetical protein